MLTLQFSGNATTGQVKEITHAGRRYLVSPVVALREGILNDTYVSEAEFGKFASSWQGRPVPIAHPKADGLPISANTPDIWANDVLGHLWNVAVDGGALKGEIWIDLDKAQMMAGAQGARAVQIVNKLRANQPLEVSTGYFCEMEATPGTFNGYAYGGIARNIRPDHLAILPDEIGACSWADGCGTPRINQQEDMSVDEQTLFQRFLGWLKSSQSQNIDPAVVDNSTITQEIVPEANISVQERDMNKTELIGALVANCKCKFSQEKLATWAEGDLQVLQESLGGEEPAPGRAPAPPLGAVEATPEIAPSPLAALPPEITQFAEMIRGLGGLDKLAAALGGVTANADRERSDLISAIVANHKATWSEAELRGFDTPTLHKLHGMALPRDYSGNGGAWRQSDPEEEELLMQWPMFEKKEGK
jgi:hypothetical protein